MEQERHLLESSAFHGSMIRFDNIWRGNATTIEWRKAGPRITHTSFIVIGPMNIDEVLEIIGKQHETKKKYINNLLHINFSYITLFLPKQLYASIIAPTFLAAPCLTLSSILGCVGSKRYLIIGPNLTILLSICA
jgi:hypothetical protein